jgi:hypothetical protein
MGLESCLEMSVRNYKSVISHESANVYHAVQYLCLYHLVENYYGGAQRVPETISGQSRKVNVQCLAAVRMVMSPLQSVSSFYVSLLLKMGPIGCPETSVRYYHYALSNNPEAHSSKLLLGVSLKWCN